MVGVFVGWCCDEFGNCCGDGVCVGVCWFECGEVL